jgi:predicted Zn-dependent protease
LEGQNDEADSALKNLERIKEKLGYWATPHDRAFFMDAAGEIYERMGSFEEAEIFYRDALAYNPHFALARIHLARLFHKTDRRPEALEEVGLFLDEWSAADPDAQEIRLAQQLKNGVRY